MLVLAHPCFFQKPWSPPRLPCCELMRLLMKQRTRAGLNFPLSKKKHFRAIQPTAKCVDMPSISNFVSKHLFECEIETNADEPQQNHLSSRAFTKHVEAQTQCTMWLRPLTRTVAAASHTRKKDARWKNWRQEASGGHSERQPAWEGSHKTLEPLILLTARGHFRCRHALVWHSFF